jgi:hypothetical protein
LLSIALVAATFTSLPVAATSSGTSQGALETPVVADLAYQSGALTDAATHAPRLADAARALPAGGRTVAGEQVDLRISRRSRYSGPSAARYRIGARW